MAKSLFWGNVTHDLCHATFFYVSLQVVTSFLGSGWECSDLSVLGLFFKYKRSKSEREKQMRSQPSSG